MQSTLLATKLYPPSPQAKRVQRPRLVQRLNGGLAAGRPLTLISAPVGFGKTTCAGEWLNGLDRPVAWLSLDAADDDPHPPNQVRPPPFQARVPQSRRRRPGRFCPHLQRVGLPCHPPAGDPASETTYGEPNTMNEKILVTYATRAGSTAEVAATIAQALSSQGAAVDVLPLKNVKDLKGYRAVVLGSAVRMGQWLPEAVKFVEQNQASLNGMPAAFFTVHILNLGDDEASRTARQAYLDPLRKFVTLKIAAFFAGVGNWKKVSFLEGLMGKMVKAPEGDFRDWPAIRAWAEGLGHNGLAGG